MQQLPQRLFRSQQLYNHCRSIKEFVKKYEQSNKPLDILVNNASIFITEDGLTEDGLEVHAHLHVHPILLYARMLLQLS